jgi:hypothetical protein
MMARRCVSNIKNPVGRRLLTLLFVVMMVLLFIPIGVVPVLFDELKRAYSNLDISSRVADNFTYGVKTFVSAWNGIK